MTKRNQDKTERDGRPPGIGRWVFGTGPRCRGLLLISLATSAGLCASEPGPGQRLATELSAEYQFSSAAIEYRRLALASTEDCERGAYYWAAAYAYLCDRNSELALKMLDHAEDACAELGREATLLRLECALSGGDTRAAAFYAESLMQSAPGSLKHIAQSRQVHLALLDHNAESASALLPEAAPERARQALQAYASGRDKRPRLGGFLGMVPGLGYAYAGEYANALRSLILNGLFIYGMVDTAEDDHWGAFSIITFFEITWYTGSIYGGIDASHRYNARRLQACIQTIDDQARFSPDLPQLPAIVLKYAF